MLIDSHAHLDDDAFAADLPAVLDRARQNDVGAIVTVGTSAESSRKACTLAEREPDVFAVIGVHPHEADRVSTVDGVRDLATHAKVVAVGETGLDYAKKYASLENQERLFRSHVALAQELKKPVVIHCREAHRDVLSILREANGVRGVIHCFSGTASDAQAYLDLGFYLSIAGPVTFRNAEPLREAVRAIPLERMFVETDCPLLAPQPHRGGRNEPAYVRYTAAEVARLHGCTIGSVAEHTTSNARSLFGI